jgi:capsular exopolysaccharide synthesis family protein
VFLLCVLLAPTAALAVSLLQEKVYTAKASLLFRDPQFDQKLFGSTFVQESQDPAREAATNVELVSLEEVAARTARRLGRGFSGDDVSDAIEVEAEGQSDVVSISGTAPDPKFAARLANTFGEEYVDFRREADRSKIREAQQLVRRDVSGLSAKERRSDSGEQLAGRLGQLGVLASLQTGNAELAETARAPDDPSSPQPVRNAALGLVLGALLGIGLALLVDRLDRRLRDPKEVEDAFERPVLAGLPESSALKARDPLLRGVPEGEREAFRMLRANLRYFNVSRDIRSVLITSSGSGDGKSTVAWGLAVAAASSGSRTLLVEADLRHPSLAARYGFGSRHGLTSVLTGEVHRADAVNRIPVAASANDAQPAHSMDVMLAGPLPPNPTDLIESPPMADLIRDVEREYDLVVVDTPPVAIVSDAIPLLTMVGGVIVVSRLGQTTRDAVRHLRSQLDHLEAPLLGVVVNSVYSGAGYYGYGYGYGSGRPSGGGPNGASAERPPPLPTPSADRPPSRPQEGAPAVSSSADARQQDPRTLRSGGAPGVRRDGADRSPQSDLPPSGRRGGLLNRRRSERQ